MQLNNYQSNNYFSFIGRNVIGLLLLGYPLPAFSPAPGNLFFLTQSRRKTPKKGKKHKIFVSVFPYDFGELSTTKCRNFVDFVLKYYSMNFVNYYLFISINNTLLNEFLNKIIQNTIHQNIMNFVSKFQRKFRQTENCRL